MRLSVVGSALLVSLMAPLGGAFAQHHGHPGHVWLNIGAGYGGLGYGGLGYGGLGPIHYGPRYGFAPGLYTSGYVANGVGLVVWPAAPPAPLIFAPQPQNVPANFGIGPLAVPQQPVPPGQPFAGNQPAQAPPGQAQPGQARHERPERKPRVSNLEARTRAGKFIDAGDRLFRQQRFREALERYKSAVPQAPDMAEIFLRQGFAESAIGQYETAIRFFRRGLKIQSNWRPGELRLDDLYGADNKLAKAAHFEALAQQAQAAPHDPNLLFVLGLELEFDGQSERALPFLLRASQLGANEDHALDAFLEAAAADPAGGPIVGGDIVGGNIVNPAAGPNIPDPAMPGAARPVDPAAAKGPIVDL